MRGFVVGLFVDLSVGGAPKLLWEFECLTKFWINHGYACGNRWLVMSCQEVKCVIKVFWS